ncbi:hypothetical protein [Methyloceanibacter caenitepidi]|uniref:hypothetical protein n=1 Tax=Methyloceanibacter caenitepidi TaxID=1384459 RepID=UPI0005F03F0A|nr:hypothetical protein [Methyloceanibacter caenitepidi]
MRIEPTEVWHLLRILDDLSEQNRAEHEVLGLSQFSVLRNAQEFMKKGHAYTGVYNGRPVFAFGVIPDQGFHSTWFLATAEYFNRLRVQGVVHARRFLKEIVNKHGPLVTGSASPHPGVDRWFQILGFQKYDEIDGVKWFVYYPPRADVRPEVAAPGNHAKAAEDVFRRR